MIEFSTFIDGKIYRRVSSVQTKINEYLLGELSKIAEDKEIDLNSVEYILEESKKSKCCDPTRITIKASLKE